MGLNVTPYVFLINPSQNLLYVSRLLFERSAYMYT
uniref:Uncharacterized protein n=1 Tax=Lepeophtheirus salmonis TaxID=72036 RepID=A0A0K2T3P7_LEPSM